MILEIEVNDDEYPEVFATVLTPGPYSGVAGWGSCDESALRRLKKQLEWGKEDS